MHHARLLAAALACSALMLGGCGGDTASSTSAAGSSSPASATSVAISNFSFAPPALQVSVGQTVTWSNRDGSTHTVTSVDGKFDTGTIAPGASGMVTFRTVGTFRYRCNIHQFMMGTVTVG